VKIYTELEIKSFVSIDREAIRVVEDAFTSLLVKEVQMPPIMRIDVPEYNGEVDIKSAYIPGYDQFAVKLSSGFFHNERLGLPSGNGMMILLSSHTGLPQAIFLDNGYLTHVRTAAAGAISAKYLAKKTVEVAGVIGTGSQARFQMKALQYVRPFKKLLVYGRNKEKLHSFVSEMKEKLKIDVYACQSAEEVVRQSDIVVTTTPSDTPIIEADWLHPGLHITAMGSDAEHKQEVNADVFQYVDKIVCDTKSQCVRLGELHHAFEKGILSDNSPIIEMGQLTSGELKGRRSAEEITICDLTGTGVQDTAIALEAFRKLKAKPIGVTIDN
jgi:ectoine utilization protein EutC